MRLFSYVVARDYGFAPNPFHGYCTLATCKPRIRKVADVGDWVLGTGSKCHGRDDRVVFAMRVTEALTFDDYWDDSRFMSKRPNLRGSKKQAFGDNVYHRVADPATWLQENSHHSHADGTPNIYNIRRDTSANRVLVSDDFVYWGKQAPELPVEFTGAERIDVRAGRNHRSHFPESFVRDVVRWVRESGESGFCGEPFDWHRSP